MGMSRGAPLRLSDAHVHLQDPRTLPALPQLLRSSLASGVRLFAVNGTSQKDWHIVKQLADDHPSIVPCFGLHPWLVEERSPDWFSVTKELLHATPSAAIGEAGLDKGSRGKQIDFQSQVHVFQLQLELANELKKPISVHCVRAYSDLLKILQMLVVSQPFTETELHDPYLWDRFPLIPTERILCATDAPDALPPAQLDSLKWVPGDKVILQELISQEENTEPGVSFRADRDSHKFAEHFSFTNGNTKSPS